MKTEEIEAALEIISQAKKQGIRAYKVQMSECGYCCERFVVFPRKIDKNGSEFEFIYAMSELENAIEALDIGKCIYFQPSRDDRMSKGIITRVL